MINYYQKSRHLFGKLKIEVLDADGRVMDELPASPRRGLNRVVWSMREKAPRVPPAVQLAFAGTQGPLVLPGTYTVRMTKGGEVYESKFDVRARSSRDLHARRPQGAVRRGDARAQPVRRAKAR